MKHINKLVVFLLLIGLCFQASAKKFTIKQLEQLAKQYVIKQVKPPINGKIEVLVSKQDPRTRLPDCTQSLQFSSGTKHKPGKNITVKIICPDNKPWRQYIPVRVKYLSRVLTAKNQLEKGSTVSADDIELTYIDNLYLRGSHFSQIKQLIGSKVKQRITTGSAITTKQICVVCKGELVTLSVVSAGLELKTQGIAQSNGNTGEQVRVRNKRSKRIVYGRVKAIGQVQINL